MPTDPINTDAGRRSHMAAQTTGAQTQSTSSARRRKPLPKTAAQAQTQQTQRPNDKFVGSAATEQVTKGQAAGQAQDVAQVPKTEPQPSLFARMFPSWKGSMAWRVLAIGVSVGLIMLAVGALANPVTGSIAMAAILITLSCGGLGVVGGLTYSAFTRAKAEQLADEQAELGNVRGDARLEKVPATEEPEAADPGSEIPMPPDSSPRSMDAAAQMLQDSQNHTLNAQGRSSNTPKMSPPTDGSGVRSRARS